MRKVNDNFKPYPVVMLADDETPLADKHDHDGDCGPKTLTTA